MSKSSVVDTSELLKENITPKSMSPRQWSDVVEQRLLS